MHYCFFTSGSWEQNAAHIRIIEMGRDLIDRGHRVTYMLDDVPYNRGDLGLHPKSELAFVKDSRSLKQITNRRKLFKQLQPDYVHLLQGHAKSYSALVGMDLKLIGDWDEPRIFQDFGFVRNRIEAFVDRWLRKHAFVRIACTAYIQKVYRERFGMETVYIPHAPYLPSYPEVDSPFTEPTAVYMGNFFAAWDHDIALHAAVILKERGLMPPMLFMGSGPDFEKWKAYVAEKELSNVKLPGFVSGLDLWRRLRHAHV